MSEIKNLILGIITAIILFDIMCFLAWTASGQTPLDGFYMGAVTARVLQVIVK